VALDARSESATVGCGSTPAVPGPAFRWKAVENGLLLQPERQRVTRLEWSLDVTLFLVPEELAHLQAAYIRGGKNHEFEA